MLIFNRINQSSRDCGNGDAVFYDDVQIHVNVITGDMHLHAATEILNARKSAII